MTHEKDQSLYQVTARWVAIKKRFLDWRRARERERERETEGKRGTHTHTHTRTHTHTHAARGRGGYFWFERVLIGEV